MFFRARNEVVLYDDVRPTLERLVHTHRLFAISNGNADLAAIGLADYFEASLSAREAGMLKPDPRIFDILLQRSGLRAAEVVHVGDDPEADVEGARGAGVQPVWLNRDGLPWPCATTRLRSDLDADQPARGIRVAVASSPTRLERMATPESCRRRQPHARTRAFHACLTHEVRKEA
jgi:FMN phosphatase YigB (HAD superfamily)